MNYRHSYHAGNFADVLKHSALALILRHLAKKDTAFRYLDTHAGIGAYDLAAVEPTKTGDFLVNCAQLCGNSHAFMRGLFMVKTPADYAQWVAEKSKAGGAATGGFE